jgi:hypothetical protein
MYFGYIGTNSENQRRGMISVSCNQEVFRGDDFVGITLFRI